MLIFILCVIVSKKEVHNVLQKRGERKSELSCKTQENKKKLFVHPNNNHVYDKLFTFKLPCVNSSADDIAVLQYEQFFKYISFYVLKISVNGVFLCLLVSLFILQLAWFAFRALV